MFVSKEKVLIVKIMPDIEFLKKRFSTNNSCHELKNNNPFGVATLVASERRPGILLTIRTLSFEFNFSTLYTTIPRAQLKSRLKELIQRCSKQEQSISVYC
jgi:hypothetical protein